LRRHSRVFVSIRLVLCPRRVPGALQRPGGAKFRGAFAERRLTDAFVRSQPPPAAGRLEIADSRCAGLVLRITAAGARSWSYRYRDKATGRPTRLTIGAYPAVTLTAARSQADAMRREVAGGGDPADRKRRDRAEAGARSFSHWHVRLGHKRVSRGRTVGRQAPAIWRLGRADGPSRPVQIS
jgi:hypothetical protein